MKKVILSMLVIGIMSALANTERCTSVGATDKKYTPQGDCGYKTENRICCDDKQWSAWKEGKVNKAADCQKKDCSDGESGTGTVDIRGSNGDWSNKTVGKKTCKRVCKNGNWEYSLKSISCGSGWQEASDGSYGKVCIIGQIGRTSYIKRHPSSETPSGTKGLPSHYRYNDKCNKAEHGYWRYEGEDEEGGVTNYLKCEDHGLWNDLMGKAYYVNRIAIDWVYTKPEGCEGKFNLDPNSKEGAYCSDIGNCIVAQAKANHTAKYLQCIEADNTGHDEDDCSTADYD